MARSIEKDIIPRVVGGKVLSIQDDWEKKFEKGLDEMVRSFIAFPKRYPQDYRDRQFARHLLWHVLDERGNFAMLFLKGTDPQGLSHFWIHLMPYIDGRFPEKVPKTDIKLVSLNNKLYELFNRIIMVDDGTFEDQMDRVVVVINEIRAM